MKNGLEIERKFLVRLPDTDKLNIVKTEIMTQIYLEEVSDNLQRRIRKINCNGEVTYTYTEKHFITAITRKEMEYNINEKEFERLLSQKRRDTAPVEKTRYSFEYENQLFELDVYPFSDELAVMEIELKTAQDEISFPENVEIIKEVTSDSRYANASLATAGCFPE